MTKSDSNTSDIFRLIKTKNSKYWMEKREERCLYLFKEASKKVPAYSDFLRCNGINAAAVKTWDDFQKVPQTNKSNYLKKYKLEDLCWDGTLEKPMVFTATSGSTGEPVYFSRYNKLDWQYSIIIEQFLDEAFRIKSEPTLVVICFGMGLWIGGLITYKAFEIAANRRNYPVSIITPGINKGEIFKILKNLSPNYNQIVFAGYPPFIKDIVDESEDKGIDLKKKKIRILFAAEAVSEEFRDYLVRKAGIKNVYKDFLSIYGSADIGAMAYETSISILIRRIAGKDRRIFESIFTSINKNPTLAQFNPVFINFEEAGDELLLTGDSAMPLVRYAIGDHGGVFSFDEVATRLKKYGVKLSKEIKKMELEESVYQLPFVYVYEREDLSTTFYGLLIYPEWIRPAFLDDSISEYLTGKFGMRTIYDSKSNQYIEVNIELRKGKKLTKTLEKRVLKKIVNYLTLNSSEYGEIHNHIKNRAFPVLHFWPADDVNYFKPGVKQKWVLK